MTRLVESDLTPKTPKAGVKILHLSDLHFTRYTRFCADRFRQIPPNELNAILRANGPLPKPEASDPYLDHLVNRLVDDAETSAPFDLVLVTGDLVDFDYKNAAAHQDAMNRVCDFLLYVCAKLRVSHQEALVMVAGNHDYLYQGIMPQKWAPAAFRKTFKPWLGHRWYSKLNLLIGCFDSNVDSSSFRAATGFVNTLQLGDLKKELALRGVETAGAYRLALVHHHLMPIATAENLTPATWWERWFGRKLIGTPELMLMRNSGTFTHFLLEHGFQLALHGHLHRHDSGSYQSFRDGRQQLLELIACGATGRPIPDEPTAFNVLHLLDSGVVQASAHQIDAQGLHRHEDLKTVAYETIRASRHDQTPGQRVDDAASGQPVLCNRYTRLWDVRFPAGDLVSDETIEGLRCRPGQQCEEVLLLATINHLDQVVEAQFSAVCLDDPALVKPDIKIEPVQKNGERKIQVHYVLRFTKKPLTDKPVTIRCRRMLFGVLPSSREAHRLANLECTPHILLHTIYWPCEQVLLRVRIGDGAWPALGLRLDTEDPLEKPAPWEESSTHVMIHAHPPLDSQPPEAIVAVYRPRLNYSYGVLWDVPEHDMNETDLKKLRKSERALLALQSAQQAQGRAAAESFLASVLQGVQHIAREAGENDPHACALLFGFNRDRGKLERVASVDCGDFHINEVQWGRDVIGTAFQRQAAVFYSKSKEAQEKRRHQGRVIGDLSRDIPDEAQVLFAVPLPGLAPKNWPIAALALISTDARSGLHGLLGRPETDAALQAAIYDLWTTEVEPIMGLR